MPNDKIAILERALQRERRARKNAEEILEAKSLELYETNQQIEALLDDQSAQMTLIIDNSSLGIVLMQDRKIIKTNKALIDLLGYTHEELSVLDINKDLTHPNDIEKSDRQMALLASNDLDRFSLKKRYQCKDGSFIICNTNVSAVRDTKGNVKYFVALIENITEIEKKTKMLNALNKLSVSILGKRDLHEIAWEIAKSTANHLNLEDCVVYALNYETNILTQIAAYNNKSNNGFTINNPHSVALGKSIVGIAAQTGTYQLIKDTTTCAHYEVDDCRRLSELAVPIIANGKVIGVIDSENSKKNYFNQEHIEVFRNIANLASAQFNSAISLNKEKKAQKEKDRLLDKLEKNNEELKNFAHVVSHDLKSPLRSISALMSWIMEDNDGEFDEDTTNNCNLILGKIDKMDSLISGILQYSSIDKFEKTDYKVPLEDLVNEILDTVFIPKNINISRPNKLPVVYGDKFRYQQLFQNLISNAVKYNDKEDGLIEINVEEIDQKYLFSIKDNGVGIDKKYYSKIFEVFETLGSQNKHSTGVGLSIVKKIVDLYQGKIWIESELGLGTTFFIELDKNPPKNFEKLTEKANSVAG
ncbi:Sensory transduction histidine kinase (fragment) [Tenacibaculum litopenaei]|jgi:PAS domain S-box-containing protein|uniref:ATP-binding protein n=1 Tax=Tenacibaculum litopenaei TaxID=396016 RepID=UPI0038937DC8